MNTMPNLQTKKEGSGGNLSQCQDPDALRTAKKSQLRQRVEARIRELEESLLILKSHPGNDRRCSALETELQVAQDCMIGGWARVGDIESAKLTQWLDNTKYLTEKCIPEYAKDGRK